MDGAAETQYHKALADYNWFIEFSGLRRQYAGQLVALSNKREVIASWSPDHSRPKESLQDCLVFLVPPVDETLFVVHRLTETEPEGIGNRYAIQ